MRRSFCDICRHRSSSNCTPPSCHLQSDSYNFLHSQRVHLDGIKEEKKRGNYFRSVGYLVTSVVDKLIGRCMARRLASSGTSSTPPVIIQLRCLLHFGGVRPSLTSLDATISADDTAAFSLFARGSVLLVTYFALQSQKQFAQHCDGILIAFDFLSICALLLFDLNGESSNSSIRSGCDCELDWSMVFISVWSVQPFCMWERMRTNWRQTESITSLLTLTIDFINDCLTGPVFLHGA